MAAEAEVVAAEAVVAVVAVLVHARCTKQHVQIVGRKPKCLSYLILTGRFIAEIATKTTDQKDSNPEVYGHTLFFKSVMDS